jgi:anti-sigma factor RsiW
MSNEYRNNPINGEEHVHEQLSDYMDGLLPGAEREAVRAHLETCVDCRADYIELRATRKLMQNMPAVTAPRAFTLTPEMASKVRKPSFWEALFVRQNAPRLATGSLVAFLLLFLFVANDFLGKGNPEAASTVAFNHYSAPSVSSGDTSQPPSASSAGGQSAIAPTSQAAAAATNTTAPSAAEAPDQTLETEVVAPLATPPAPQAFSAIATPQESSSSSDTGVAGTGAAGAPPNNGVTASGNSSPTTTTLSETPDESAVSKSAIPPQAAPPPGNNDTGWIVLQIALLGLGLGLGAAAFIAWRRS